MWSIDDIRLEDGFKFRLVDRCRALVLGWYSVDSWCMVQGGWRCSVVRMRDVVDCCVRRWTFLGGRHRFVVGVRWLNKARKYFVSWRGRIRRWGWESWSYVVGYKIVRWENQYVNWSWRFSKVRREGFITTACDVSYALGLCEVIRVWYI